MSTCRAGKCSVVVCLKWNSWLCVNLASRSHWTKLQRTWTLVDVWGLGNWNADCVCVCVCVCSAYSLPPRQSELSNLYRVKRWPHCSHDQFFFFFVSNLKHYFLLSGKFPESSVAGSVGQIYEWKIQFAFSLLSSVFFQNACWFEVIVAMNSKTPRLLWSSPLMTGLSHLTQVCSEVPLVIVTFHCPWISFKGKLQV